MSENNEKELREQISNIYKDDSISDREKSARVQKLMMNRFNNTTKSPSSKETNDPDIIEPEYQVYNLLNQIFGCKHYQRKNKILSPCCNKWYTCRLCHNDENDHEINRNEIATMACMLCKTIQPASQTCQNCHESMSDYYCSTCHLWDNTPNKPIYHCDDCGICRRGEGIGLDNFHCKKCNACLALSMKDTHTCIERNLESNCPICGEYLFTSVESVSIMECGHAIHQNCLNQLSRSSYQCPTCLKSLADMSTFYRQMDQLLQNQKMPREYRRHQSKIFCNDCRERSQVKFHFIYHKCAHCSSYNTSVLETIVPESGAEEEGSSDTSESTHSEMIQDNVTSEDIPEDSELLSLDGLMSDESNISRSAWRSEFVTGTDSLQDAIDAELYVDHFNRQLRSSHSNEDDFQSSDALDETTALHSLAYILENDHHEVDTRDAMTALVNILDGGNLGPTDIHPLRDEILSSEDSQDSNNSSSRFNPVDEDGIDEE